jgi:ElaA protein
VGSDGGYLVASAGFDGLTTRRLHDILRLRCDVFVVEQACAYPELDGRDVEPGTGHHWIDVDGELACYLRTLAEPDGATRIGRVVTAPGHRGRGLAAIAVTAVVDRHAAGRVVLDAQSYLVDWYRRLGFEPDGAEFVEDGIPHVPMRLVSPP